MTQRKSDADEILAHLNLLKQEEWLGKSRSWWPDYLFRFDPLEAAASILNSGRLLSRNNAKSAGVLQSDCASPDVIANTAACWKDFVRLYFRPRTPTQYHNEGFRPAHKISMGAHCPMPIVMLFEARTVLTRADAQYSEGNVAANPSTGGSAAFLRTIPFKNVYHVGPIDEESKRKIIFHRHAEVMIPGELDLASLRFVGCRTQAEYETLRQLLTTQRRKELGKVIGLGTNMDLHFRLWTFVESVEMGKDAVTLKFNPSLEAQGPFSAHISVLEHQTGKEHYWREQNFYAKETFTIRLKSLTRPEKYTFTLKLDERIAYRNEFDSSVRQLK